jgi:hypothetical protein
VQDACVEATPVNPVVAFSASVFNPAARHLGVSEAASLRLENMVTDTENKINDPLDELLDDEDDWEDEKAYSQIIAELPPGWQLVKVFSYTHEVLLAIREWCEENCQGPYREVNWESGCSYSTGMEFELDMDTILFKLRWGC